MLRREGAPRHVVLQVARNLKGTQFGGRSLGEGRVGETSGKVLQQGLGAAGIAQFAVKARLPEAQTRIFRRIFRHKIIVTVHPLQGLGDAVAHLANIHQRGHRVLNTLRIGLVGALILQLGE